MPNLDTINILSLPGEDPAALGAALCLLAAGVAKSRASIVSLTLTMDVDDETPRLGGSEAWLVQAGFPVLKSLKLVNTTFADGLFFERLSSSTMQQLCIMTQQLNSFEPLASIGRLSHLVGLSLHCDMESAMPVCTCLTNLRSLELSDFERQPQPLEVFAPVLLLTQLVRLRLLHAECASDSYVTATAHLLRGLVSLEHLFLGSWFVAGDETAAAIYSLTRLTLLDLSHMKLTRPVAAGQLPRLQHLGLMLDPPHDLLQTLTPLMPLPCLTHLYQQYPCVSKVDPEFAADVVKAEQMLASAPNLWFDASIWHL